MPRKNIIEPQTFEEEYRAVLRKHGVEFDER
jgi:hypothetical protein